MDHMSIYENVWEKLARDKTAEPLVKIFVNLWHFLAFQRLHNIVLEKYYLFGLKTALTFFHDSHDYSKNMVIYFYPRASSSLGSKYYFVVHYDLGILPHEAFYRLIEYSRVYISHVGTCRNISRQV